MKQNRFTESQIVCILKQQEAGAKVMDICREHGISDATLNKQIIIMLDKELV
jgi:putative transposase